MTNLHVVPTRGEPFDHALEGESVVVGRSSDCDLVLADRFLSRRHTRIFKSDDSWMVEDLGSRNGTLLNGDLVGEPTALKIGDRLQLCGSVLIVQDAGAKPAHSSDRPLDLGHSILRPASDLVSRPTASEPGRLDDPDALRMYTERLTLLNEIHHALSRPISQEDLMEMILARAFDHLRPEEGVIFLRQSDGSYDRAAFRKVPGLKSDYLYSTTLIEEVAEKAQAALVLDIASDERFAGSESILSSGVRSLIAAPLADSEGSVGMIALNCRISVRQFNEDDLELLASLASVAALRIRNVALAEEAAERKRLEEEMRLARQIQVTLLPEHLPEVEGLELYAGNVPSRGASGDYYMATDRADARECVLMLADVSGKGIAAALLTASLEALAAGPIEAGEQPDLVFGKVSRWLHRRTPASKYATAVMAVVDAASGTLQFTNAGHNPALLVRASGDVERLDPSGLPLGLMPSAEYRMEERALEPGDTLILYSDGITEAANPRGEEYGIERLAALCAERRTEEPDDLGDAIESDLLEFAEGEPFADDRTLVIARLSKP
jgi:serine phosphatase RsbU (regulator of sigma subunit)